jgi:hypothetical protein
MAVFAGPNVSLNGLQIMLDWGNSFCYPKSGITFKNLVDLSRNDGYLKNNVTFLNDNGGVVSTGGNVNGTINNDVGDRIDINTSQAGIDRFTKDNNFSFIFWNFYISGSGRIWSTGSAGAGTGQSDNCIWNMYINQSGFFWWNTSGGGDNALTASFNGQKLSNVWQLVGITYSANESGNNVLRLWINGNLAGSTSISSATHSAIDRSGQTNMQWTLGGGYNSSCRNSASENRFGPFYLYNRAVSQSEMQILFAANKTRFGIL